MRTMASTGVVPVSDMGFPDDAHSDPKAFPRGLYSRESATCAAWAGVAANPVSDVPHRKSAVTCAPCEYPILEEICVSTQSFPVLKSCIGGR